MSYVYIPYDTIRELIHRFQCMHPILDAVPPDQTNPAPNFVLIDPRRYYGSYGGIFNDTVLQNIKTFFTSSSIGHGHSVVWFPTSTPPCRGDCYGLSFCGRVAVPVSLFKLLHVNTVKTTPSAKSNYFGSNPSRMYKTSFENSSSE